MFSYLSSIFNYFFQTESDKDDSAVENFVADELLRIHLENNEENTDVNEYDEIPQSSCFQRSGIVSYIGEEYIIIDDAYYFDLSLCSLNIRTNDTVRYLGYTDEDGITKIIRILEVLGQAWGDVESREETFDILEHVIIGEVDYRKDRNVFIKDNDLVFDLDTVLASFVPIKGDWLEMKSSMQWNEEQNSAITPAQVLKVLSIKPLRTKVKKVTITEWNGTEGTCDRNIYFNKQTLNNPIEPRVGVMVYVEAIESNQGVCTWRALNMILDDKYVPAEKKDIQPELINIIEKQKNIDVTFPIHFDSIGINESVTKEMVISNNSENEYILNKWLIVGRKRDSQIVIKPYLHQPVYLYSKSKLKFSITCQPKFLGSSKEILVLQFKGFQIKRTIEINVQNEYNNYSNKNNSESIYRQTNSYSDMQSVLKNSKMSSFLPGERPKKPPAFISVRIGQFNVPDKIWTAVLGDSQTTCYTNDYKNILDRIETQLPCLTSELNIYNYTDIWHTLLYMEEIQQNISMRSYDMEKAFLIPIQEYLSIDIPGLSEKRPSLICGDKVIAKDLWNQDVPLYEGFVHEIRGDKLLLKFNRQFHEIYNGTDVSLEFHGSRTVYRRCHQAVNLAISNLGVDLLFPSRIMEGEPQVPNDKLTSIKWFNNDLNDEQKAAVTNVLIGSCRPMPYCIYGPPGTGKTMTVVEVILQILFLLPDSRILVATPSNSAANLITERLLNYRHTFSESLVRLIANHYITSENLPKCIKPFCATLDIAAEKSTNPKRRMNSEGINIECEKSFIGRHRVTIGTCVCLGSLIHMGFPKGHFTHVIVDEAGQAIEPEIMIPMTFTDKENTQIILAGDPMQLGPVVMSKYCKEFGMDESYFSRILKRFPYQKDFDAYKEGFDKRLVTRLNVNYRSLVDIIELPSDMFYDKTLVPKLTRKEKWIQPILDVFSEIMPCDSEPGGIYVYGIVGQNLRAEDSPSWYNPHEASMVALTTCKLYKRNISPDDIGIITPYIAQIKHLRMVFDAMGLPHPKIGTVEEFQGQEKPIIIISTVRSTDAYIEEDIRFKLGFVKDPKRLNVAITRAQVALILFCNPHLLSLDVLWSKFISHALLNDKYFGCNYNTESQGVA